MKVQSAIEFLMTYSWAFIIIAIALVVLLGLTTITSPSTFSSASCYLSASLQCQSAVILVNSINTIFAVEFVNNIGQRISFPANAVAFYPQFTTTNYLGGCFPVNAPLGAVVVCNTTSIPRKIGPVGLQLNPSFTISYQLCRGSVCPPIIPANIINTTGFTSVFISPYAPNLINKITLHSGTPGGNVVLDNTRYPDNTVLVFIGSSRHTIGAVPPVGYSLGSWTTSGATVNTVSNTAFATNTIGSITAIFVTITSSTSTSSTSTTSTSTSTSSTSTSSTSTTSTSTTTTTIAALSPDGSNTATCNAATSCSIGVTTADSNDIIIIGCACTYEATGPSTYTVTGGSLTWNTRIAYDFCQNDCSYGAANFYSNVYYAIAPSPLSGTTITITQNNAMANSYFNIVEFAVNGVNLAAPFDPNAVLPAHVQLSTGAPTVTGVSTTNANDLVYVIGSTLTSDSGATAGSCGGTSMTLIKSQTNAGVTNIEENAIASSPLSSVSCGFSGSFTDYSGTIADALESASNLHYVPITLTNSQGSATPSTFQQLITVNSVTYNQYIDGNWDNVEFWTGTGGTGTVLQSWVELNPTNTATNTIVWVSVPGGVPASGTNTIYMTFYTMGNSMLSSSGPAGEAPQLSGTYAHYDNGANMFPYYQVWGGLSSLPSGWSQTGGMVVTFNPSNTYVAPSASSGGWYSLQETAPASMSTLPTVFDFYGNMYDALNAGSTAGLDSGCGYAAHYAWSEGNGATNLIYLANGGQFTTSTGYSDTNNLKVYSMELGSATSTNMLIDYGSIYSSGSISSQTIVSFCFAPSNNGGGIPATTQVVYWLRTRAYPPSGIMPSPSFGSVV